jgi:uncharacterized membrane protein
MIIPAFAGCFFEVIQHVTVALVMINRKILLVILVLTLAGIADSSYALYQHYAPANASACDITETINCTAINQSQYSVLLGIPVAGLGVAGYLLMAALLAGIMMKMARQITVMRILLAVALGALAFSGWLTYVEIFILKALCPLCVTSLVLVVTITIMVFLGLISNKEEQDQ